MSVAETTEVGGAATAQAPVAQSTIRDGFRRGLPIAFPTAALGVSFGVLAKPVMGSVAPIVMSTFVFAGGAQFAALSVLQAAGTAGAAIAAGVLMNARFVPMSLAATPSLRGRKARRAAEAQSVVDAPFVMAARGDGSFDRGVMIGATLVSGIAWVSGTIVGVLAGTAIADPSTFGLDAIFPAFYLLLLAEEFRRPRAPAVVAVAGAVALGLMTFAPPGVPVIAASAAALIGLRR
jgi:4-azaleucine resistance transporter AzlC